MHAARDICVILLVGSCTKVAIVLLFPCLQVLWAVAVPQYSYVNSQPNHGVPLPRLPQGKQPLVYWEEHLIIYIFFLFRSVRQLRISSTSPWWRMMTSSMPRWQTRSSVYSQKLHGQQKRRNSLQILLILFVSYLLGMVILIQFGSNGMWYVIYLNFRDPNHRWVK